MVSKLQKDGYGIKGRSKSSVDISLSSKGKETMIEINKVWDNYDKKCNELIETDKSKQLLDNVIYANEKLS